MEYHNALIAAPEEERGIPTITGKKQTKVRKLGVLVIVFVMLAVFAAAGALFIKRLAEQKQAEKRAEQRNPRETGASGETMADLESQKKRIKQEEDERAAAAAIASNMPVPAGALSVPSTPVYAASPQMTAPQMEGSGKPVETLGQRRLDSGVLVISDGTPNVSPTLVSASGSLLGGGAEGNSKNALDDQLSPSATARAGVFHANFLPNLTYLLKRGTIIPCVMGTKVVTTYPGMTSCTVTQDVYSADGHTLLVRKGAEALGEQRNALLQGQARIFALWTRIDDGPVTLSVNSPATDPLGGSGIEAYVDEHFWKRFGGALMVSLIGDFGQAFANKSVGSNNNTIALTNTSQATQDLASETLKNTINIPPTGYANQGALINIYVARDIDFSNQYELVSMSRESGAQENGGSR